MTSSDPKAVQPTPDAARRGPVERLLGDPQGAGGPFALLALAPEDCADETILAALERRLERLNGHPEADTPEADEVRLALHAAAAQLLDPAVRRHLIARWTGRPAPAPPAPAPAPRVAPPPPSRVPSRAPAELLLEHEAVLTLGLFGGWNKRSLRRLLCLAHARGLTSEALVATLRSLGTRKRPPSPPVRATSTRPPTARIPSPPSAPPAPTSPPLLGAIVEVTRPPAIAPPVPGEAPRSPLVHPPPAPPSAPYSHQSNAAEDPGRRALRNVLLTIGAAFASLTLLTLLALVLSSGRRAGAPTPTPADGGRGAQAGIQDAQPAPSDAASRPSPGPVRPTAPAPASTEVALLSIPRELAATPDALRVDPAGALERFTQLVLALSNEWGRLRRDQLVASHAAVVEFVYRAGASSETLQGAIAAVGQGAERLGESARPGGPPLEASSIWPGVWSLGMLVRLGRERDLPASARFDLDARVSAVLGHARASSDPSFEWGAAAALLLIPRLITPPPPARENARAADGPERWERWAQAAEALAQADAALKARLLLAGLETVLVAGAEPTESRDVFESVAMIVGLLGWRPGDDARRWLLRAFDDRRLTSADLAAVTSALATRSAAPGVDITMVLSAGASARVRADLRDRYARVWALDSPAGQTTLAAEWSEAARAAIERSRAATDSVDRLGAAVVLARLNEAATLRWRGQTSESSALVADLAAPIDRLLELRAPTGGAGAPPVGDGAWAERYYGARRAAPLRIDLLDRRSAQGGVLGPIDAEAIAAEACLGSPQEVVARARQLVAQFADSPAMAGALLELLPRLPLRPSSSALVETVARVHLPSIRDPDWPAAARRALVERLLELIAAQSDLAVIDHLARELAVSYRAMAVDLALTPAERQEREQPAAHASAGAIVDRWRAASETLLPGSSAPGALDEITRRRAGRLAIAHGAVAAFAAEQITLAEMMAHTVAGEQPGRAERVRLVMTQLAEDRRRAAHVFEQIGAAERAITQLWLARFQEDAGS